MDIQRIENMMIRLNDRLMEIDDIIREIKSELLDLKKIKKAILAGIIKGE